MSIKLTSYFISAGEQSGEQIASELIRELNHQHPHLKSFGIGGEQMTQAGCECLMDIGSLNIMGVSDVIAQLGSLRLLESKILTMIDRIKPDFAVLVDFPALHFRLAEQLKLRGIKVIQYVAPKLWAWGMHRMKYLKRDFDLVLGILPFEEEFFLKNNVPYKYCGSPNLERLLSVQCTKKSLGFEHTDRKLIALLPGSRLSELHHLLPIFFEMVANKNSSLGDADYVVPLAPSIKIEDVALIYKNFSSMSDSSHEISKDLLEDSEKKSWLIGGIRFMRSMSLEVLKAADFAVVCSGTATLECAILGTPMVVAYKTDATTYEYARSVVSVSNISLVNLILGREAVPELIQNFNVDDLVAVCTSILKDDLRRMKQLSDFDEIKKRLAPKAAVTAALEITKLMSH